MAKRAFPELAYSRADHTSENWKSTKIGRVDLAGVAQWIECWPVKQRVTGSIPNQST